MAWKMLVYNLRAAIRPEPHDRSFMNDTRQFHLLAGLATGHDARSDDAIYQAL